MKKSIIIWVILLSFSLVYAEHTLNYPYYFDVNVSEEITIENGLTIVDQTAYILISGNVTYFNKVNDNQTFQLYLTGSEEKDEPYFIQVFNSSITQEQENSSDNSRESFLTVDNQTSFGFRIISTDGHNISSFENHDACPYIKKQTGNPIIKTFVSYDNGTDLVYTNSSTTHTVVNTGYEYICLDTSHIYQDNVANYSEYFGFWCTNCDASNKLRLGIDTSSLANNSITFENQGDAMINNTANNYMLIAFELEGDPEEEFTGVFKFRTPYYVNLTLYNSQNTTFNTNFNYIYLRNVSSYTSMSASIETSTNVVNSITSFGGLVGRNKIDTKLTYWGEVEENSAIVKLYEAGNYSITLLTVKTFVNNGWSDEFTKPQYTSSKVETILDSNLIIESKNNLTANVLLSEYEANKAGYLINIVKTVIVVVLLLAGIGLSFLTPQPFASLGAMFTLWLILIKLIF